MPTKPRTSYLFLFCAGTRLAAELFAGSLRHVFPLLRRIVPRCLARARMARGAAIVLPGLRDAVALFLGRGLWILRAHALRDAEREHARHGRLQQLVPR